MTSVFDKFYNLGYDDYFKGLSKDECPYADDTAEQDSWIEGWEDADSDDDSGDSDLI